MALNPARMRNLLGGIALAALALAGPPARAAEGDHDGRWRLEYSCGQNTANGAAPYRARIELFVEGGAVAARTATRNTRLNRDDTEQWSGRFTGAALAIKVAGSASDGAAWDSEWTGAASSPTEGSVTGAVFAPVRGARAQVRACEGRMTLVAPAPASLAAAATRQQEVDAAATRQQEAVEAAARQRMADEAAARQREADAAAARQRDAAEAARAARGTPPSRSPSPDGRASPQATLEAFLEAHAGHRGLDLVLLADVGQPRGAFQRGVGGGLVLVQKTFCVEAPLLYAEPERAPIPLRALGEAAGGLPEVVGVRTADGALARSPASQRAIGRAAASRSRPPSSCRASSSGPTSRSFSRPRPTRSVALAGCLR